MKKSSIINHQSSIYILHGWTYSLEKWTPFLNLFKKEGLQTTLLPIPGLTEENDKIWDISDYVNWLYEILKREKEKIILLGHSNGGRIALAFALKYPEKLSKLVLIDTAGIYHNDLPLKIKRSVFGITAKVGKKILPFSSGRSLLYTLARERDYKDASPNMRKTMINLINADKNIDTSRIKVPTIIIWGRDDKVTPLNDAKILNREIVNSQLYIINNCSHSPQFTHPKEVSDIIIKQFNNFHYVCI